MIIKKIFCIAFCFLIICSFYSCHYRNEIQVIQTLEETYAEVVERRNNISTHNRSEFATAVNTLTEQLDTACLNALKYNDKYYDFYIRVKDASKTAVEAYEEYLVCKYQSGSIAFTLIANYEYSTQKQITQNVISLLESSEEYYPVEHDSNITNQTSDYYKQLLEIHKKIATYNTVGEMNAIFESLEELLVTLQTKAEFSVSQTCLEVEGVMAESIMYSFDRFLALFDDFEERNIKALGAIEFSNIFVLKSQLYAKLEKALLLCSLID